jgi:carbon-monoxide dehydrogenase small subunit
MKDIHFTLNGEPYEISVKPWSTLLDVLRDDLLLTGTKEGCGLGECGACTVILEGKTVNSCLVPAPEVNGKEIVTIEGLADGDALDPIQEAFITHGGSQCGFCTPGIIVSAKDLLTRKSNPSEEDVREAIAGNLCRCTGYTKVIESIDAAAGIGRGGE